MKKSLILVVVLICSFVLLFVFVGCSSASVVNEPTKQNEESKPQESKPSYFVPELGGKLTFGLNADATGYEVVSYEGGDKYIAIPETYNNLPVTGIASRTFVSKTISTIIFPDSIKVIPYRTIYNGSVQNVVFGSNTQYDNSAICECYPKNVYYKGTKADWDAKEYGSQYYLQNATVRYYSETQDPGKWHFDDNGRIAVWS